MNLIAYIGCSNEQELIVPTKVTLKTYITFCTTQNMISFFKCTLIQ